MEKKRFMIRKAQNLCIQERRNTVTTYRSGASSKNYIGVIPVLSLRWLCSCYLDILPTLIHAHLQNIMTVSNAQNFQN